MEDILDNLEENVTLSDKEIFTEIWTSPRSVFKFLHKNAYDKHVPVLLVLAGIASAIDRAVSKNIGDQLSVMAVIFLAIIVGGLFGWISYYIYSGLISWTGKWLKGQQDTKSILRVLAYSALPTILGMLINFLQIAIYGVELFQSDGEIILRDNNLDSIVFYGLTGIQFVLAIWAIVLLVVGISEIQQFSIAKALLNVVLPVIVILVPMLLLFVLLDFF